MLVPLDEKEHTMASCCPACQRPLAEGSAHCDYCPGTSYAADSAPPVLDLSTPMFDSDPDVRGIGGWLVLVLLALIASPIITSQSIWTDFNALTGPNHLFIGLRLPGLPALIGFELFANLILLAGLLLLNIFFFREDHRFPRFYQLWLGISLAARMAEYTLSMRVGAHADWEGAQQVIANLHGKLAINALEGLLAAIIWISYLQVSRRVRATFVN
jgi:Protein of unknown function (DUF2569)